MSTPGPPSKQPHTFSHLEGASRRARLRFEGRVTVLTLVAGFPGVAICALLLWIDGYSARTQWTVDLLLIFFWLAVSANLKNRVVRPLQTLSNILAAIREGDYSIRGRRAASGDALGEVMLEVNDLGATLRGQRLGAMEATALLRTVMAEMDSAIFAFDPEQRLRLVNRAGEKLLAQTESHLLGQTSEELGLSQCLNGHQHQGPYIIQMSFPGAAGRWEIRCGTFREGGMQHQLLVLSDLSKTLREEERSAWQRLLRVLGHELNNSLAPIKSVAGSLDDLVKREMQSTDWRDDMHRGLGVISSRADSLSRFVESYSKLARLPPPRFERLEIGALVTRVAALETRLPINITSAQKIFVRADGAQLEQLLINLIRNAVDATLETSGGVEVGWRQQNDQVIVYVKDEGLGIANPTNLFVPFFTTKASGSGIGLVLSRQIAEAHGGSLTLQNRVEASGCEATLTLPTSTSLLQTGRLRNR